MAQAQEFEKVLDKSDKTVASFDDQHKSLLKRAQHTLHSNQAAVPLIVLIASVAIFGLLVGGKFFNAFSLTLIIQQVAIVGIVGAAQTLVILTAGIDLSVGAIMVLSSVVMGQFTFRYGIPVPLAILCGLGCGTLCGFINGWLVAHMKLPPFIVTLGIWQVFNATKYLYSANETIRTQDIEAQAPLLQFFGIQIKIGGAVFTLGVIFMVLLVVFLWYVLNYTAWGRRLYAVGDDPDAADLAGVPVEAHAAHHLHAVRPHLRHGRLGADRPHRLGVADGRRIRQHRIGHRRGDRRHLAVRRPRLDPRHDLRGADRRRLLAGPAALWRRRAVDLSVDRRSHHRRRRRRPVDQKGSRLMAHEPILTARSLVKRYGRVTALDHADFDLYPGEILAVIGDNGAGKSTLDQGDLRRRHARRRRDQARRQDAELQDRRWMPAMPASKRSTRTSRCRRPCRSADNMFLGREIRKPGIMGSVFRMLDRGAMEKRARDKLTELGLMTIQNISQAVETLSGGQRQGVAVARAAAFGSKVVIMDEPTAALGVKESRRVLELILDVKKRGLPIVLISHNMPHVFEVADRIHIHRLGKRLCVIDPKDYTMSDAVAFMTGAKAPPQELLAA